jgi:aspartate aminotransferase-like enzyme
VKKNYLMTPGPTPVPPEVLLEMAKPLIHHRTPQYQAIFKKVNEGLKTIFKTANDICIFTSSGTGAMEASVANVLSPGDKAIVVQGGKFGERFGELCKAYGIEFIPIDVKWGSPADPKVVKEALDKNMGVAAVYTTLAETSTGTVNDIKSIGAIVKEYDAVLVVDAISGLGADDLQTDAWGVDMTVSGSQKGLMIPPGLSFITVSKKAWTRVEKSKLPKYYYDLKKYKKALADSDTPFTSAVSLFIGLQKSLEIILSEGMDNVLARHAKMAKSVREGVKALGLQIYSSSPSNAVTPINVPAGINGELLVKTMRDKYGVTVAGGQSELKGKIFRIAHLGFMENFDCIVAISALEIVLTEMGYKVEHGKGLGAVEKVILGK